MLKFVIKLQGENYEIEVKKKRWFFFHTTIWKRVGFYTTRFVAANTANEAIEQAFTSIKNEITEIGRQTDKSNLILLQIEENEELYNQFESNSGFTFYEMD